MQQTVQTSRRAPVAIAGSADEGPGWAQGLRHLYMGVAAEPVPAELRDMLVRLAGKP